MHFVAHWEFVGTTRASVIEAELRGALSIYSWVRPLTNFYIIHVQSSEQYQSIVNVLLAIGRKYPSELHFLVTPPMAGGSYSGQVLPNFWPEINSRAT